MFTTTGHSTIGHPASGHIGTGSDGKPEATHSSRVRRDFTNSWRRAVLFSALICLLSGIGMISYAVFSDPAAPEPVREAQEAQMLVGGLITAICLFPALLYLVRYIQYRRHHADEPADPLALLASISFIPVLLGIALLLLT